MPKECMVQAFCLGGGTCGDVAGFDDLVQACGPTKQTLGLSLASWLVLCTCCNSQQLFTIPVHIAVAVMHKL